MKILFFSSLYPPHTKGGGELSTHYIAQGLAERGHEVTVITSSFSGKREETSLDGVSVLRLPVSLTAKPLFERRMSRKIARILLREISNLGTYDVVHAHDFRSTMALAEMNLPKVVATARDYAHICGSPNNLLADGTTCPGCNWLAVWKNHGVVEAPGWRKPFRAWQYAYNIGYRKKTWQQIQNHIFISRAQQAEFARGLPRDQVQETVIYNPVPAGYLTTPSKPGVSGNVLFVGTLQSYKGIGLLLAAWPEVANRVPHAHLKIVGEGAERTQYERLVERSGLRYRVTFTGRISPERMMPVYDEASVIVSPHIWVEPFGRTVVEAMARGKIVVAANIGGPAETIQDNQTGLLFEHNSVGSLIARLHESLTTPDARQMMISRAAQKWVRNNLSADLIARAHEEFYQRLVGG